MALSPEILNLFEIYNQKEPVPIDDYDLLTEIYELIEEGKLGIWEDSKPGIHQTSEFITNPDTKQRAYIGGCSPKAEMCPWVLKLAYEAKKDIEEEPKTLRLVASFGGSLIYNRKNDIIEGSLWLDVSCRSEGLVNPFEKIVQHACQNALNQAYNAWKHVFKDNQKVLDLTEKYLKERE